MKLRIEKVVYGGAGLAHPAEGEAAGRAVFVPFTLPGELVEASATEGKGGFVNAELVEVVEASSDRGKPGCAHFGECGGCHYQHASYKAQLEIKTEILRETLERAGLAELPEIQVHAGEPWHYRNRIRLRVAKIDGVLRVGYLRRGSNDFLPIRMCPIAAPLLWRAAEALLKLAETSDAAQWMEKITEVEFFTTQDESTLQMTVFTQHRVAGFDALCKRLQMLLPELMGAGASMLHAEGSRRAERPQAIADWGAEGLRYTVADEKYWVSRGGFFQVNRFLVEELVRIVAAGRRGALAWDLYSGVGLFSRALKTSFEEVVAVEAAADDLVKTFKGNGRRAVAATTVEFLRSAVVQRERPELVVMDPPRAGVGAEVCALLGRVQAKEIVYVSCDPVTLARDLKALVDFGYRINELHMVDMFPQTFHQETVVVLDRP
ncbi:MAG TPA: 23S rRNA (uracil(1939)-C(5))-methyltransferase RlmD [Edaphobacter sp.]|uniref:23S rRNA (uracil(1939)-C(5))-methyltransferase RlmD n=1 Tax=Edaphobacter sp. TaxID=1934404 RepID=UPI002CC54F26|nr:23S rRNA (uracil(1939)-C(5))-methyltransferase RlmD [Edaphobacter sp.]HUZ97442.1 23S rRNA (uracil(1939)-C(5))-methyltransferase RlmD [Edaphobacter sp.]